MPFENCCSYCGGWSHVASLCRIKHADVKYHKENQKTFGQKVRATPYLIIRTIMKAHPAINDRIIKLMTKGFKVETTRLEGWINGDTPNGITMRCREEGMETYVYVGQLDYQYLIVKIRPINDTPT